MNERRGSSAWVVTPLLLITMLLGWRILALGLADRWAAGAPEQALSWRPDHTDAIEQAAGAASDAGNLIRAETLARRGIAAFPLDGRNYRVLATVADARGDLPRALQMFAIALQRSPRDLRTHMKLAEYALKAGDMDGALRQLDPILRIEPEEETELFPRMIRLTEAPTTAAAFIRVLSQRPPWRARFLQTLVASERDPDAIKRIYRAMQASASQALSGDEMEYWVKESKLDSGRLLIGAGKPIACSTADKDAYDAKRAALKMPGIHTVPMPDGLFDAALAQVK